LKSALGDRLYQLTVYPNSMGMRLMTNQPDGWLFMLGTVLRLLVSQITAKPIRRLRRERFSHCEGVGGLSGRGSIGLTTASPISQTSPPLVR
jgi:hypothetical protein